MRPDAGGRHCASCARTIADFTQMSDARLLAFVREHGHACGRFRADQLDRDVVLPRRALPGLRAFFTITIPAFLLSLKAGAQNAATAFPASIQLPHDTKDLPVDVPRSDTPRSDTGRTVTGQVTDSSGNVVPFATVGIWGTKTMVSADVEGRFSLKHVPAGALISVSATGYNATQFPVGAQVNGLQLVLSMREMMGEYIVVRSVRKKPRPFKSLFQPKAAPAPIPPSVSIYPNPVAAGSDLHIQGRHLEPGAYHIELYNLAGQLLAKGTASCSAKSERMTLTTAGVPAGNYLVRVVNEKTGKALSAQAVLR
ncbi:carboxypeptidase-like regulatory domain-containing protein [Flaviaesturariibacter aridisoli]|nr:carboxypeptidase-like regulatory domain-containing protein [Flaviaesturariibacter aridisoli]